jgi:hypothetical protein
LALGVSSNKAIEDRQKPRLMLVKIHHSELRGSLPIFFAWMPLQTPQSYTALFTFAMLSISLGHSFFKLHRPEWWHPFAPLGDSSPAYAQASSQLCSRSSNGNSVFFLE